MAGEWMAIIGEYSLVAFLAQCVCCLAGVDGFDFCRMKGSTNGFRATVLLLTTALLHGTTLVTSARLSTSALNLMGSVSRNAVFELTTASSSVYFE